MYFNCSRNVFRQFHVKYITVLLSGALTVSKLIVKYQPPKNVHIQIYTSLCHILLKRIKHNIS